MKRNLKLQQKRLKRERKKAKENLNKSAPNLYWPTIFCTHEKMFIGLSYNSTASKYEAKHKVVDESDWKPEVSIFRDEKYRIDFSKFEKDTEVCCPNCGKPVDFRIWISSKRPEFTEITKHDKEVDVDKLPDTQAFGN